MLCQQCKKNPATVHFKSVVGDQAAEWDLCAPCAQDKGLSVGWAQGVPSLAPSPFGSLSEMIAQLADAASTEEASAQRLKCPHCGLSYAEFRTRGRLGCGHCYAAFRARLKPLLRHIHGHAVHAGKTYLPPAGAQDAPAGGGAVRAQEVKRLEAALKEAVRREDFESAARLRDELRRYRRP
jgi:protein arginine kinase activator